MGGAMWVITNCPPTFESGWASNGFGPVTFRRGPSKFSPVFFVTCLRDVYVFSYVLGLRVLGLLVSLGLDMLTQ